VFDLPSSIGRLIRQAAKLNSAGLEETLREYGVTIAQFSMLRRLADSSEGLWGAGLARDLMVTPQAVQQVLAGLEEAGLVERRADLVHGRIQRASLTQSGERLLASCEKAVQVIEQHYVSRLTDSQCRELERLLRRYIVAATEDA
jgi:DNA-binding MarR family transcriptional regulator